MPGELEITEYEAEDMSCGDAEAAGDDVEDEGLVPRVCIGFACLAPAGIAVHVDHEPDREHEERNLLNETLPMRTSWWGERTRTHHPRAILTRLGRLG